jgi:maltose alpha-D-glucosyltransferase / alpha-amylase
MLHNDPLWYKDALIYELHVRAFHDSDGDGVGDFRGLTEKLDFLEDLGITAIWLLPFYPSPLKDDGYDIADYTNVHPNYGNLADFRSFLNEAHRRGIQVITELVINHTSDQHPWFQRARLSPPGSPERDFYVWSDTPEKYKDARIIFKDFELSNWTWDPVAKSHYWHRFYHHQPDLNFDNPAVWNAIFPVLDFWMEMGVDGMRLDAIPYLYERDGTNCENLPETHVFLKALRQRIDEKYPRRMFLAEANQWPEDAVAYFGDGDECHVAFHFPLMPRLFMGLHQEDRFPILDILGQTPAIPPTCQWCIFLRNHDELTLEMVTDEERDYMYRAYAQDRHARINLGIRHRLAPLLRNDRRRIELMNALLFSLPGTPVIYYGDEIGMGDNIYLGDRNGVRTPMQWSADRNAGFSRANPQKLYLPIIIDPEYHYEAINVEAQQNNPSSLLWWMKRLIALRKRFKAFGRGTIEFIKPDNSKVLVFVRSYQEEHVLVVANLSRFVQHAELDLRPYKGLILEELFGRSQFPPIRDQGYPITLGPHQFYWFSLGAPQTSIHPIHLQDLDRTLPDWFVSEEWSEWIDGPGRDDFEKYLPTFLGHRLLSESQKTITNCRILRSVTVTPRNQLAKLLTIRVEFRAGLAETVFLPIVRIEEETIPHLLAPLSLIGIVRLQGSNTGILCDALGVKEYCQSVVAAIFAGRSFPTGDGELLTVALSNLQSFPDTIPQESTPVLHWSDRNNVSVSFGERLILKTFRRMEEGVNPDLQIGQHLSEKIQYPGTAPVLGYVEYRRRGMEPITLAVLHEFVRNQGNAWQFILDQLSRFFERVAALSKEQSPSLPTLMPLVGSNNSSHSGEDWVELMGGCLETARQLGITTANLHRALANDLGDPTFTPERFTPHYQRSLYQSMRNLTGRVCRRCALDREGSPDSILPLLNQIYETQELILKKFHQVLDRSLIGMRIRCHGDYHLGQLLYTGKEFIVIDFEGETNRTIGERRLKRSPFRDVASMIRSFDYAVSTVLLDLANRRGRPPGIIRPEDRQVLAPWGIAWYNRMSRQFVSTYISEIQSTPTLSISPENQAIFLELFLLEKSLQEIDFELSNRPDWTIIPLRSVLRLLGCSDLSDVTCF